MKVVSACLLLWLAPIPVVATFAAADAAKFSRRHTSGGGRRKSEQHEGRSRYWWQTALDFFNTRDDGDSGDLPSPSAAKQQPVNMEVPGEAGLETDEMLPTRLLEPRAAHSARPHAALLSSSTALRSSAQRQSPQAALAEAQAHGLMVGAKLESKGTDSMWHLGASRDEVARQAGPRAHRHRKQVYVEEYDELPDPVAAKVGQSRSSVVTAGLESTSKEDLQRVQAGDVEINRPVTQSRKRPRRLLHRPRPLAVLHQHAQQKTSASLHSLSQQPPGNAKMQAQCVAYASFLKGQNVVGPDLVKAWSGTCMPAVHEGKANPKYSTMCSALVGAVEPFALDSAWSPEKVCEAVVRVFKESGLGATPLQSLF